MLNLNRLLWIFAVFPWLDFILRVTMPSAIGSIWDELFLITILFFLWKEKKEENRLLVVPNYIKRPFYIFLVFSLGSIIVNVVPLAVSIDVLRVVYQPMFFGLLTIYLLDDEETLDKFMKILIISTAIIAILGIIQYIFQIESIRWQHKKDAEQFRIVSIFSNPNALASYLNMILSFTIAFILYHSEKKTKIILILLAMPMFAALLLTFSRSGWIAFFFMVVYFVWVWNKKWLALLPLGLIAAPFILPDSVINRFANLFDPTYYQMSSEYGRISFWTEAVNKIIDNPIFGVGMGMFGDSVPLRHNIPFSTWVDNHYLKLGAEIGIFGLLGFVVFLLTLFILASRLFKQVESNKDKAYLLGISGVIITMSVQNVTASIFEALTNAIYFYAFIGMLFAFVWKQKTKGKC